MGNRFPAVFVFGFFLACVAAGPATSPIARKAADGTALPPVTYKGKPAEVVSNPKSPDIIQLKRMLMMPPDQAIRTRFYSSATSLETLSLRMTRIEAAVDSRPGSGVGGVHGAREETKGTRHVIDGLDTAWFTWGLCNADVAGFDLDQGVICRIVLYYKAPARAIKLDPQIDGSDPLVKVVTTSPYVRVEIGEKPPPPDRSEVVDAPGPDRAAADRAGPDRAAANRDAVGAQSPRKWSGTGFLITSDGFVVTNRHVVHGAKSLSAIFSDGSAKAIRVVLEDDIQDLALARIDGTKFPFVSLSAKDSPADGAECTVIGYPMVNEFGGAIKITHGVVSDAHATGKGLLEGLAGPDIAIDAKVNPGNSGGPIVDKFGNIMAVVSMKTVATRLEEAYGLGISAGKIRTFLTRHPDQKIRIVPGPEKVGLSVEDLVARTKPATVFIVASE
jgi:hypothetical protein